MNQAPFRKFFRPRLHIALKIRNFQNSRCCCSEPRCQSSSYKNTRVKVVSEIKFTNCRVIYSYVSIDMWVDALRVCRDYLPSMYPVLQAEYSSSGFSKTSDVSIESLLSRANEWALAGQHVQAIECLLQVNSNIADPSIVKRALLRAADTINKFLFGEEALGVIKVLAPRFAKWSNEEHRN